MVCVYFQVHVGHKLFSYLVKGVSATIAELNDMCVLKCHKCNYKNYFNGLYCGRSRFQRKKTERERTQCTGCTLYINSCQAVVMKRHPVFLTLPTLYILNVCMSLWYALFKYYIVARYFMCMNSYTRLIL